MLSSGITVEQALIRKVMQPEATETAGMTQPPEEENVNPTQTTATTKKIRQ